MTLHNWVPFSKVRGEETLLMPGRGHCRMKLDPTEPTLPPKTESICGHYELVHYKKALGNDPWQGNSWKKLQAFRWQLTE